MAVSQKTIKETRRVLLNWKRVYGIPKHIITDLLSKLAGIEGNKSCKETIEILKETWKNL